MSLLVELTKMNMMLLLPPKKKYLHFFSMFKTDRLEIQNLRQDWPFSTPSAGKKKLTIIILGTFQVCKVLHVYYFVVIVTANILGKLNWFSVFCGPILSSILPRNTVVSLLHLVQERRLPCCKGTLVSLVWVTGSTSNGATWACASKIASANQSQEGA